MAAKSSTKKVAKNQRTRTTRPKGAVSRANTATYAEGVTMLAVTFTLLSLVFLGMAYHYYL